MAWDSLGGLGLLLAQVVWLVSSPVPIRSLGSRSAAPVSGRDGGWVTGRRCPAFRLSLLSSRPVLSHGWAAGFLRAPCALLRCHCVCRPIGFRLAYAFGWYIEGLGLTSSLSAVPCSMAALSCGSSFHSTTLARVPHGSLVLVPRWREP